MSEPEPVTIHRVKTPRFWVELESRRVPWEGELRGLLCIDAETGPQRIVRAVVTLLLMAQEVGQAEVLAHKTLSPGDELRAPFAIRVPWGSGLGKSHMIAAVQAGPLWQHTLQTDIEIVPPLCCMRAAEVVSGLTGLAPGSWGVIAAGDGVSTRLEAQDEGNLFRSIRLDLFMGPRGLYGQLQAEMSGKRAGLGDTAQFFLGRPERHRVKLALNPADPESARERLEEIVRGLRLRTGPEGDLPIPAAGPPRSAESLPLPASEPPHEGAD
jgi:hypothetical protein